MTFKGHENNGTYGLDLTLSDLKASVGRGTGTLTADVTSLGKKSEDVVLADLKARSAALTPKNDVIALDGVTATLTDAGAKAFSGYYPKGTALDPVDLSVALTTTAALPSAGPTAGRRHHDRRATTTGATTTGAVTAAAGGGGVVGGSLAATGSGVPAGPLGAAAAVTAGGGRGVVLAVLEAYGDVIPIAGPGRGPRTMAPHDRHTRELLGPGGLVPADVRGRPGPAPLRLNARRAGVQCCAARRPCCSAGSPARAADLRLPADG